MVGHKRLGIRGKGKIFALIPGFTDIWGEVVPPGGDGRPEVTHMAMNRPHFEGNRDGYKSTGVRDWSPVKGGKAARRTWNLTTRSLAGKRGHAWCETKCPWDSQKDVLVFHRGGERFMLTSAPTSRGAGFGLPEVREKKGAGPKKKKQRS